MKPYVVSSLFLALALAGGTGTAEAQVSAGIVLDRDGPRHFHLAVGEHYGVPYGTVSRYHSRGLHTDELPVVLFMAREARVSPETVIALRERGWAWVDVAAHLGLHPRVFASHLPRRSGPPFGKAHGYWRNHVHRGLTDRHIVDFVNVRFLSDHYGRPVQEVIVYRDRGSSFYQIQQRYTAGASPKPGRGNVRGGPPPGRGAGNAPGRRGRGAGGG